MSIALMIDQHGSNDLDYPMCTLELAAASMPRGYPMVSHAMDVEKTWAYRHTGSTSDPAHEMI